MQSPALPTWLVGVFPCAVVFMGASDHPQWVPAWQSAATWNTESFLVSPQWVTWLHSPFSARLPTQVDAGIGTNGNKGLLYWKDGMSLYLPHRVVFLNFVWWDLREWKKSRLRDLAQKQFLPHLKPWMKWQATFLSDSDLIPSLAGVLDISPWPLVIMFPVSSVLPKHLLPLLLWLVAKFWKVWGFKKVFQFYSFLLLAEQYNINCVTLPEW